MKYTELFEKMKKANPEFLEEVVSLSPEALDARLAQLSKDLEASDKAKEEDLELENAVELAKELAAPYREASKAIRMKSKFIVAILREKGLVE